MSVGTTENRLVYSGDGVAVNFSFNKYLRAASDLKVVVTNDDGTITPKTLGIHYTFAFSGSARYGVYPNGGIVTFLVAPAADENVVLYRDVAKTQPYSWTDNDPVPAATSENSADLAVLHVQRLLDLSQRSVRLKDGFAETFDTELPEVMTPDYVLAVNSTGDGFELREASPVGPAGPAGPAGPSGGSGTVVNVYNTSGNLVEGSPVDTQHVALDASGGAILRTLPQALAGVVGQVFHVKKVDNSANNAVVAAFAGDQILTTALVASVTLDYQGKAYTLVCRAVGVWDVI